jgi:hypothetical protein
MRRQIMNDALARGTIAVPRCLQGNGEDMDSGTIAGNASPAIKAAALIAVALGSGFGAGSIVTLASLSRTGELPMTPWGFRAMSGPFEQLGQGAFTILGSTLVGVCALQVVAGVWLWQGRRRGAQVFLATTPLALGLGAGFALPFLLAGVPISAALVLAGRRGLR